MIIKMKLVKPFGKALYDFFFQSPEDYANEMERCRQAQINYLKLRGNIRTGKKKRQLRYKPHRKV